MTNSEAFVKARGGNLIGKAMYGGGKITMKQLYLQSFEVVFDAYFKSGLVERFFSRKGQMGGNSQKICMIVEGTRCTASYHEQPLPLYEADLDPDMCQDSTFDKEKIIAQAKRVAMRIMRRHSATSSPRRRSRPTVPSTARTTSRSTARWRWAKRCATSPSRPTAARPTAPCKKASPTFQEVRSDMNTAMLGGTATINDLVSVARFGAKVAFSKEYEERVNHCRAHVDRFSHEGKAIYGLTTGLGDNWKKFIPEKDRKTIQRNNIYAHTCAVGEPIAEECTRAMMFVMLCHFGSGHTGIRLETLALIRDMLNAGISPVVPGHGSVGYLTLEGHIGTVMIGEGKATYQGETLDGAKALKRAGLKPVVLSSKEGLILLSGTTSVTAFASLAIYDAQATLAIELNSSVDNPLIFDEEDGGAVALMGCNADGTYAGMASDSLCIAITDLCKMSNSRIDRLLNSLVSELPAFLNKNADFNNGLMMIQYASAGLQGELRILAHPAVVDNLTTCANQEDYVNMGCNAAKKAYDSMHLAKYILAAELICDGQALDCYDDKRCAKGTQAIYDLLRSKVPEMDNDMPLTPYLEAVAQQIIDRAYIRTVEASVGALKF